MRSLTRYGSLAALAVLMACTSRQETAPEPKTRAIAPQQYSVADFYKNAEFFGASWSPAKDKILISSNLSGIWNAYVVPAEGGRLLFVTPRAGLAQRGTALRRCSISSATRESC